MSDTITVELPVNVVRAWMKRPTDQRAVNLLKAAMKPQLKPSTPAPAPEPTPEPPVDPDIE